MESVFYDLYGRPHKVKEDYEVITSHGRFKGEDAAEQAARVAKKYQQEQQQRMQEQEAKQLRACPLQEMRLCVEDCAFFDVGCMKAAGDTLGKRCPFNPCKCTNNCGLYDNGCIFLEKFRKDNEKNEPD